MNKLIILIQEVCVKIVNKMLIGIPREWVATVKTSSVAPNGVGEFYVNGDLTSDPITLKNKSWETLSQNDEVYIHSPTGKLLNSVVLYKK